MAQIKLVEIWKSINLTDYPIQWKSRIDELKKEGLKTSNKPDLIIKARTSIQDMTFINDAARVWNTAKLSIQ